MINPLHRRTGIGELTSSTSSAGHARHVDVGEALREGVLRIECIGENRRAGFRRRSDTASTPSPAQCRRRCGRIGRSAPTLGPTETAARWTASIRDGREHRFHTLVQRASYSQPAHHESHSIRMQASEGRPTLRESTSQATNSMMSLVLTVSCRPISRSSTGVQSCPATRAGIAGVR
jgi:hypothetical protein